MATISPFSSGNDSSSFFFMSSRGALFTEGCFQHLSQPVSDMAALTSEIHRAFEKSRQAGINTPVVVGAIPFDTTKPSALFIPKTHTRMTISEVKSFAESSKESVTLPDTLIEVPKREAFFDMVESARESMHSGTVSKVVLSRLLQADLDQPLNHQALLSSLVRQNNSGYQFNCPLPGDKRLIGSSPELLLNKHKDSFTSQPLAGSAKRNHDNPLLDQGIAEALMNSTKDRYEHQIVIESMKDTLRPFCQDLNIPDEPELINTPSLWHLATTIQGKSTENALSLAASLHPTPALSGFPHNTAASLLKTLEPFDRDFFGGIVGWCNEDGDGEWAISIRCAETSPTQIRLFAGAGIVPASDPASEWKETGTKLTTMLRALGLNEGDIH